MNNDNLWFEILKRLETTPECHWGAVVTLPESLGNESRFYWNGNWEDLSFAPLCNNLAELSLSDIFPDNPERD